ncbi:MAG TPA: adenylate/guanylate cyclase domain-containing protein [Nitrospirae bacterium]|nr:adenylate/guanylate cyclase domain-containing protein [Nitrospirota bacterium]
MRWNGTIPRIVPQRGKVVTFNRIYAGWLIVLAVTAFNPPLFIEAFDLKIYDLLVRYSAPNRPDPRIIIVGIDQKSLDVFGRWPWPRDKIGEVIEKLEGFGARVIALDMTFHTHTDFENIALMDKIDAEIVKEKIDIDNPKFYGKFGQLKNNVSRDRALAGSIGKAGNVVTGFFFEDIKKEVSKTGSKEKAIKETLRPFRIKTVRRSADSRDASLWFKAAGAEPNILVIQKAGAASGFLNTWTDIDGIIRSHPMIYEFNGDYYPSLSLASVIAYSGAISSTQLVFTHGMLEGIDIKGKFLATDPYGRILLRYHGPDSTFPVVSIADIMSESLENEKIRKQIEGKIAIVGATATSVYDLRVTPLGITAGVEIQANAASMALNLNAITKFGWQKVMDIILALTLGIFMWWALPRMKVLTGVVVTTLLMGGLFWFNFLQFNVNSIWLNSVIPGIAIVMGFISVTTSQYITEQRSKRFIQGAFGRYLSPKVIHQIVENPDLLQLGGEKRVMTAFFTDVAGFTTISEKLEPNELVTLLNDYLTKMTDVIHEFDGTVDKFEGDAIIAFWGAPLLIENHTEMCMRAAVKMQKVITESKKKWIEDWSAGLATRMGINTGPMVVGNMGSKERMDYTMMGDSVNLAARLEGANKYYGSKILVSEFSYREAPQNAFLFRELDQVRVQGKKNAVRLYELIDTVEEATDERRRLTAMFEEAVIVFRAKKFEEAREKFSNCHKEGGEKDVACELYIQRLDHLLNNPPPDDWDAVYDLAK